MPSRRVATSTLWQLGSQGAMAALSILATKCVAIALSKELAGSYNSAYGFLQLFGILADFGLYAVALREISAAKNRSHVLGALIVIRTIISFASLGAAIAIAWLIPSWRGSPLSLGITIAALVPAFTLQAGILRTVFQVEYRMHYVFIAEVTHRILTTALIAGVVLVGVRHTTSAGTYHLMLLFGGIGSIWLWIFSSVCARRLWSVRICWDWPLIRRIVIRAAPFGLAYLFMALYRQTDVTLIALLRPDFELQNAYYGFVQRMTDMAFIIPTFLLNSTLPVLQEREEQGSDTRPFLGKVLLTVLVLGITAFLFGMLWPRSLVHLLTTPQYLSTADRPGTDTALMLAGIPMLLNGVILYGFYALLHRHVWRPLVLTLAGGAALALVLNLWFIPTHGFVGAGTTSILVHVFLAVLLMTQAHRVMPARLPGSAWWRLVGFASCSAFTLIALTPLLISSIATLFVLTLALALLGGWLWVWGLHRLLLGQADTAEKPWTEAPLA